MLGQRGGDALALFNVGSRRAHGFFHDHVAHGVADDAQDFEDGNTGANQRGQRARETGQTNLVRDLAEDGQLDAQAVPELAALLGLDVGKPGVDQPAGGERDVEQIILEKHADVDQPLRGAGQL